MLQTVILIAAFISGAAAGFPITRALNKRRSEDIEKTYEKLLTSSFDVFTPQMEIIFSFFVTLNEVKNIGSVNLIVPEGAHNDIWRKGLQ